MAPGQQQSGEPAAGATPAAMHVLDDFRWQAGALAILVLIAYANSLGSSFHFDDPTMFGNPGVVSPGFGWEVFRLDQTRPLTYLTFHWNYLVGGLNPVLYHWVNLLLHAANCILLLALARRYLAPFTAGCVAALFALHPLQTESVTYVFARATLLSTQFALWALWFYAGAVGRAAQPGEPLSSASGAGSKPGKATLQLLASALMFGISLLAKEETIALPGFLLLMDLFERRRPKTGYYALLFGFAAMAAGRLFYLIRVAPVTPGVGRVLGVSPATYLLTQSRVLWIYLRLAMAPFGLNLDHDVPFSTNVLTPWTTLPAMLALTALIGCLAWLAWKRHPAALWALGYFVLIAPSSSVVPQNDAMYEHRTYLPLVCLAMALGFLLERVPRAKLAVAFAVLIPAMLAGTIARNMDWHDEKTLWADIAAKSPNKGRTWLGMASLYPNDPAKAGEYLKRGLAVDPDNPELHNNYGVVLLRQNRPAEALAHFQRAMALSEETSNGWNNIGGAYFRLGDIAAAMSSFERALKLDPCSFNARRNLMMVHSSRNEPHEVWLAGEVPATCRMVPVLARELQRLRYMAGKR